MHEGTGGIHLDVSGNQIHTTAKDSTGVVAEQANIDADVTIVASSNLIVTEGESAFGIRGINHSSGNIMITATSNTITTKGEFATGIYGYHLGDGDIVINSQQDTITTENSSDSAIAGGILAWHQFGNGDIDIDVVGGTIKTNGFLSMGVYGVHGPSTLSPVSTQGQVDIEIQDTVIETVGESAYGIRGDHTGSGGIRIETKGRQRITTTGANGHGIVAYHTGTGEDRSIDISVGGTIDTQGANAYGVRVGALSSGNAARAAAFDDEGYRKQTVTVNGRIRGGTGEGAGISLAGGGRVFIGPTGSVGAESGIAILAVGDTPGVNPEDPAMKPKLFVSIDLDGRQVANVIGDDRIINDGGETTIEVNEVKLYDGATGVFPGAVAANGAWDVTIKPEGVTVIDRMDPDAWTVSEPTSGVVAGRDFSAQDFVETSSTTTEEPGVSFFNEVYAPRSAVYEALPGFLLRLDAPDSPEAGISSPESPFWVRLSRGRGSYEPDRSSVGAEYSSRHYSLEAGLDIPLGESLASSASLRKLRGSAEAGKSKPRESARPSTCP